MFVALLATPAQAQKLGGQLGNLAANFEERNAPAPHDLDDATLRQTVLSL
jgi:hypothetical protein